MTLSNQPPSGKNANSEIGLTKTISFIYLSGGVIFIIAVLRGEQIAGTQLEWQNDIWIPLLMIIGALATIRLTKWGRWMSYLVSGLFILGVPIGTMLAFFMIWHLTKYRAAFNRWY